MFLLFSVVIILVNTVAPVGRNWLAGTYAANRVCNGVINNACALTVSVVVYSPVLVYAEMTCRFNGVNIRTDEKKFPAVLFFCRLIIALTLSLV